jgi:hypothetical protein
MKMVLLLWVDRCKNKWACVSITRDSRKAVFYRKMVSPTFVIPGSFIPVTIYPISPASSKSFFCLSGLKTPHSLTKNFLSGLQKSFHLLRFIFPSNTRTKTITPWWLEYPKSKSKHDFLLKPDLFRLFR